MKTKQTGDQNLVKKINKKLVFHYIKDNGPVSRAHVSKETGLNKATVSTMVAELIDEDLVFEMGPGESSGGRKPVMLYFHEKAGFSIGIDLGVNYVLGILTDLRGNIVEERIDSITNVDFEHVMTKLVIMINELINKAPKSTYGIVGIGVGVPGIVDKMNNILFAPNLKWKDVNIKAFLEEKLRIPTVIENEANAGAIGEQLYGSGLEISNLVYLSIGIGIGTGIILNNSLYTGAAGISGEMGHNTIDANGMKCTCGNRGCWELYASESTLLQEMKKAFKSEKELQLSKIMNEAENGNEEVLQVLDKIGTNIGIGLTNIINTFNPEVIIIGNRMAQFQTWLTEPIERVLTERLSSYHYSSTEVRFSKLGKYPIATGASAFSISSFLTTKEL
jgi:predicted NBD/HSP70 family sugar kinase